MRSLFSVVVLLLAVMVSMWIVIADPVELHARREVERRQLADNSSITATSSSFILPTTSSSIPPTTNSNSPTSSLPAVTSSTPSSTPTSSAPVSSNANTASPSLSTSFFRSVRTFTTDVVTTINGVATTIPITSTSETLIPTTINLQTQNSTGGGLTDNSKKIVIGVLVGVGGAAIVALIAVLVWRHMRKEKERKEYETSPNLTYFGDEPEDANRKHGSESSKESGLHRSPTRLNAAANF